MHVSGQTVLALCFYFKYLSVCQSLKLSIILLTWALTTAKPTRSTVLQYDCTSTVMAHFVLSKERTCNLNCWGLDLTLCWKYSWLHRNQNLPSSVVNMTVQSPFTMADINVSAKHYYLCYFHCCCCWYYYRYNHIHSNFHLPSHKDDLGYMCQTGDSSAPLSDVCRTLEYGELRLVELGMSV